MIYDIFKVEMVNSKEYYVAFSYDNSWYSCGSRIGNLLKLKGMWGVETDSVVYDKKTIVKNIREEVEYIITNHIVSVELVETITME